MEKFIYDLKKTAVSAAQKTGEFVELGKLKIACSNTKNKIDDAFVVLGKAIYSVEKEGTDEEEKIKQTIVEIDSLYEKLAQQEEELMLLKNQKKCHSCGAMADKDAVFCSRCGEKFE